MTVALTSQYHVTVATRQRRRPCTLLVPFCHSLSRLRLELWYLSPMRARRWERGTHNAVSQTFAVPRREASKGLTSHSTLYNLFRGTVFTRQMTQSRVLKHRRKPVWQLVVELRLRYHQNHIIPSTSSLSARHSVMVTV